MCCLRCISIFPDNSNTIFIGALLPCDKLSGCRAYVKVAEFEWWRTEFTLFDGTLFWRNDNIPNSWEETMGAEYSVKPAAGQKLYLTIGTPGVDAIEKGEVK